MIAVTGARGYLGQRICSALEDEGCKFLRLTSRPIESTDLEYRLGGKVSDGDLSGVTHIIHAAHDFGPRSESAIEVNFTGSLPLLNTASKLKIPVTLVSTLSAFEGVTTGYGRSKLLLEERVLANQGRVCRAGLIIGDRSGGIIGSVLQAVSSRSLVPVVGASTPMYISDEQTLVREVLLDPFTHRSDIPILAAFGEPYVFWEIVERLREVENPAQSVRFLHINPRVAYSIFRFAEVVGLNLPFRSESVKALFHYVSPNEIQRLTKPVNTFKSLDEVVSSRRFGN